MGASLRTALPSVTLCLGISLLMACGFGAGQSSTRAAGPGLLLSETRNHLGICVEEGSGYGDSEASEVETEVAATIRDVLPSLERFLGWSDFERGKMPVVIAGCGAKSRFFEELSGNRPPSSLGFTIGREVETPNPNRLLVFVLSDEEFREYIPYGYHGEVNEEVVCGGHVCPTVTTGLYVNRERGRDRIFFERCLPELLGLDSGTEAPWPWYGPAAVC